MDDGPTRQLSLQPVTIGAAGVSPPAATPSPQMLEALIQTINQRAGAFLEREGLLVRDSENAYLQA